MRVVGAARARRSLPSTGTIIAELFSKISWFDRVLELAYLNSFFETGLKPWDIAAGCLLITEAGGMVSDLHGSEEYRRHLARVLVGRALAEAN